VTITTERNPNGSWTCSTVVNGYREKRLYLGYTKKEAIYHFRAYLKALNPDPNPRG
jgi:hypothetical protein